MSLVSQGGLLLVNKPKGITSHDVVDQARCSLGLRGVGHGGTLDPIATGLLILLVGRATKISNYILSEDKSYEVQIQLGLFTDTDDALGNIVHKSSDFSLDGNQLKETLHSLQGDLELPVPLYSAVKVKGEKLYEKARRGESFKTPVRVMKFWDVSLLEFSSNSPTGYLDGEVSFGVRLSCSKGSYVRSWVRRLGELLGCGAIVKDLCRIRSGSYTLEKALSWESLKNSHPPDLGHWWIPMDRVLPHWPRVQVGGLDERLLTSGQLSRKLERYLEIQYGDQRGLEGVRVVSRCSGQLLSLVGWKPPMGFKLIRVFSPHKTAQKVGTF